MLKGRRFKQRFISFVKLFTANMQKIAKFLAVFLSIFSIVVSQPLAASAYTSKVAGEKFSYGDFLKSFEAIESAKFEYQKEHIVFSKNGTKKISTNFTFNGQGSVARNDSGSYNFKTTGIASVGIDQTSNIISSKAPLNVVDTIQNAIYKRSSEGVFSEKVVHPASVSTSKSKASLPTKFNTVYADNNFYVNLAQSPRKVLQRKSVEVKPQDIHDFAKATQIDQMMDITAPFYFENHKFTWTDEQISIIDQVQPIIATNGPYLDSAAGRKALKVDFKYDDKKVTKYFNELKKTYETKDELENSIFGVEGFEDSLENKRFVKSFVDDSYVSVWFDEKTRQPVKILRYVSIPAEGDRYDREVIVSYISLREINKKQSIKVPTKVVSMEEALEILDLELKK